MFLESRMIYCGSHGQLRCCTKVQLGKGKGVMEIGKHYRQKGMKGNEKHVDVWEELPAV